MKSFPLNIIISVLLVMVCKFVFADDGLRLLHADKNIGRKEEGQVVRIFTGNVHFQQDTLHMFCDEARFFDKENFLRFTGSVRLFDGKNTLWADKIDYYPEIKQAVCVGNVRIKTKKDSLAANYLKYNFENERATAQDNVFLYNSGENVRLWGMYGFHNPQEQYSFLKGSARMVRIDTSGTKTDTFTVDARKLEFYGNDQNKAVATDSVVITQNALRAICDTAIYYDKDEIAWLINNPYVWYEDNQLHGHKIKARFDSLVIRNIYIYEDAIAETIVDSAAGKISKLTARQIQFDIMNKKPKKIVAVDNATSIYYLEDEGKDQGVNYATADTIKIHFTAGQVDSIQIIGGAEGIYYPADYKGVMKFEQ